jgi:N-acetylneuraminic acid mutarotase
MSTRGQNSQVPPSPSYGAGGRSQWLAIALMLLGCAASTLDAQVPQLIDYQGRVIVGSTNFTGTGQFKFALVNTNGTATYWSNDGTSSGGGQPANPASINVSNGLYSVLLGDTSLTNMTAIPNAVFNNSDVRLRIWFNDGTHGSQQLTPDQRVATVGYAVIAGNVQDGAITTAKIANGAVGSAQLTNGAVGANQLAPGVAVTNLSASGQLGVASGGIILSNDYDNNLLAAGYVKIGKVDLGDVWEQKAGGAPPARQSHTVVWTGSEMIVWGGLGTGNVSLNDGGRYNPALNLWTLIPTTLANTPLARGQHTAVWTGTEMIVWGGYGGGANLNDGARYNPISNSWTAIPNSLTNTPAPRSGHVAVWTGSEMIVWGGQGNSSSLNDGGRYNPASNAWTGIPNSLANTPAARISFSAVWTGTEMIVWGGYNAGFLNNGGRYNPVSNIWTATSLTFAPSVREFHSAVWTGAEMMVWGGLGTGGVLGDGGRYNPGSDTWIAPTTGGAPSGRIYHSSVWTGNEVVIWGGANTTNALNNGGRYNPTSNSWVPLSLTSAPSPRASHSTVWTGSQMLIFAGANGPTLIGDTFGYVPTRVLYLYQRP